MVRINDDNESRPPSTGIGPTGRFPQGKLVEHDQGELAVAMGTNKDKGIIEIHFGTSLTWLGLTASDARMLAKQLNERADELEA